MQAFVFQMAPMRVLFGVGSRERLGAELETLGVQRALIIADPSKAGLSSGLADLIGSRCIGVYDQVAPHVPIETAEAGRAEVRRTNADCCITVGGGSSTGLGKAIAMEIDVPVVAVPTTYAGSEMTPIWGLTQDGTKRTGRDPKVLPRVVLYDPELTATLPPQVAGPSCMNAMAHCVEALYAENANPVMSLLAKEGISSLADSLPKVMRDPANLEGQSQALYGAWHAGLVLGSVGMALHHKLCHVLGGTFNTPHAETHAIILPYVVAFNMGAAPEARKYLEAALGTPKIASTLRRLCEAIGDPVSLKALGLGETDLDTVAEAATQAAYYNPRKITTEEIRQLLEDAYHGTMPQP